MLLNVNKITINKKLRSFQLHLLYNSVLLNERLYYMKVKETTMCTFCESRKETYQHMFVECSYTQQLLTKIWEMFREHQIEKSAKALLFNSVTINPKWVINTVVLICKYYVFLCKCEGKIPRRLPLLNMIKEYERLEKMNAVAKEKQDRHKIKWANILEEL